MLRPKVKPFHRQPRSTQLAILFFAGSLVLFGTNAVVGYQGMQASVERNQAASLQLSETRLAWAQAHSIRDQLQDPSFIALQARRQLGMVGPNEQAYVVPIPAQSHNAVVTSPAPEPSPTPATILDRIRSLNPFD